eukprot:15328884-Ditylum_brightwellii.AAC.2
MPNQDRQAGHGGKRIPSSSMKKIAKTGLHLHLASLISGFQAAHQFPFMSQHQMEQLHGKENGVG